MLEQLIESIFHLLNLTIKTSVMWEIVPLVIASLFIVIYFGVYREEEAGWDSHFMDSLILVFVSMALFRHIYNLGGLGAVNFIDYWGKTAVTGFLLLLGMLFVRFNFVHLLPKKIVKIIGSPLTINALAYISVLFVHSEEAWTWMSGFAMLIIIFIVGIVLFMIRLPTQNIVKYIEKEKRKERENNLREANFQIQELKEELKKREDELKRHEYRRLQEEEHEAKKLEHIIVRAGLKKGEKKFSNRPHKIKKKQKLRINKK